MFRFKAFLFWVASVTYYYANDYNKALFCAQKVARSYRKYKKIFYSRGLEIHLHRCAERIIGKHKVQLASSVTNDNIGILASTIYDVGGHTQCLMRFAESFYEEYDLSLFLTNSGGDSRKQAKTKYPYLESMLSMIELPHLKGDYDVKLVSILQAILESKVKMLFVYIHMDDVISCAVLAMLKEHTDVKIVLFNHADHTFSLGFEHCHLIIELRKQGQYITQRYRNKFNTTIIPLQGTKRSKLKTYSIDEINTKKKELGVDKKELVSLSGFSSEKVFRDKDHNYLIFIRNLLEQESNLKHILVTKLSNKERKLISKVFHAKEHLLDRLVIIDRVAEYDLLLQVGDIFIDSFPLGSALSHIDVIKNMRPTIIKKNNNNELYTFYGYLYDGYEYAIDDVDEMLTKTLFLLRNKDEQQRIASKCFQYYLDTYEFDTVKARYKQLIEGHNSFGDFYRPLPSDYKCNIF